MSSRPRLSARARITALVATGTTVLALASGSTPAAAVGAVQSTLVSAVPASYTPNINDGTVYAITQVGSWIVVGGSFTNVTAHGSSTAVNRSDVLAFNQSTGALDTGFAPTLDGTVNSLVPGPTANTVYVGGAFNNVNGAKSKSLAVLDLGTGAAVSGFKPPSTNGIVDDMRLTGGHLLLVGSFTTLGGVTHDGIGAVNPTTGAVDTYVNVQLTGHHNYNGSGANGAVGGRAMDVSPDGTRAVIVGDFKNANGVVHDQIVLLDLGASSATVDPNWNTSQYSAPCANGAFDTYVEDVDFSPDGKYFAVAATGGNTFSTNVDGSRSLCDTATRWETNATGTNVSPTWVDYTGNDSFWSVAVTGTAIYEGGHARWINNPDGSDSPAAGAVPRPGIVALDPINGLPYSWNPGRNPRGAGAYALLATAQGLYVGSDTDYIGNRQYKRAKIAYFPLAGGETPPSTATAQLPSNLYQAGQLPNSTNTNVLYRVDAGGPAVGAVDNGPDWLADESSSDPGWQYHSPDTNNAAYDCCATLAGTVPSSTPSAIFNSERWDPGSHNDGDEMQWSFPVAAGTHVGVRLYFANRYDGTSQAGQRVFDVGIDGTTVLDHYDTVADAGDQTGTMHEYDVSAPQSGQVTINFTHETENPNIDGVELINLDAAAAGQGSSVDDLDYRAVSGNQIGSSTTVPNTGIAWGSTRGAFVLGNTLYYANTNGNFYQASFNGTTVGTPTVLDAYDDPLWSSVQTGSGQTYQGVKSDYYGEISSITGQFYSNGRIYYSLLGRSALYYRYFEPDDGVIGGTEYSVGGADFSNVAGMTLSGSTLYYANRNDGTLHTISFAGGTPDGTSDATVNAPGVDWRSRNLFLYGSPSLPNQPPTAAATVSCTGLTCTFNGSASTDPDGTVQKWSWDFGDASSGTGQIVTHGYATPGSKPVTLTVTDNRGATSTWTGTAAPTKPTVSVGFVGDADYNNSSNAPSVTAPAGISAGDTELLFVSVNTAGVTGTPTGLTGWTQLSKITNSTLETTVFRRTGQAGDSGNPVTVPLTATSRVDVQFADYSGVTAATLPLTTAVDNTTGTHKTPAASVSAAGSWVLSYWSDRSSATTAWTLPSSVTVRKVAVGTASARVSGVVTDSGQPVPTGSYPSLTATANSASGRGNMISLVLPPAS